MKGATATSAQAPVKWTAVLLAVLAGLALVRWLDLETPSIADLRVRTILMGTLPQTDTIPPANLHLVAKTEPFRMLANPVVARLVFNVEEPATADLALLTTRVRDNFAVYVNGELASPVVGTLGKTPTLDGAQPRLTRLLSSMLRPGKNRLDIVCWRNLTGPFLREVYFGPGARLEPVFRHSKFAMQDIARFAAVAAAMVILFAIALSALVQKPALVLCIAATLGFFLLRELHILWLTVAWSPTFRDAYLLITASAVWISCAALVNEWTGGPTRLRRSFLATGLIIATSMALIYATVSIYQANAIGATIESVLELLTFGFMTMRLWHYYAQEGASAAVEIFAAVLCLMMAVTSIITQTEWLPGMADFVSVKGEAFVQFGALSIITFIASGLARQGVDVYRLAALNNETLTRRVREKEQELAAQHAAMRATEHENTLAAERGRIMSDVHDGIGSQLLGLLIQARSAQASPERLVDGLQAALDDLYLVVDSLDTVEGSLETALGTFRTRIEPKCAAAGVTLIWDMQGHDTARITSPTVVLQICRILQEAVSNAIRHGRATALTLRLVSKPGETVLTLTDNGKGFDPATVTGKGRGLANMRKRALSIGAKFEMSGGEGGTTIRLTLPA
jgi:signal transduction histidine kinase